MSENRNPNIDPNATSSQQPIQEADYPEEELRKYNIVPRQAESCTATELHSHRRVAKVVKHKVKGGNGITQLPISDRIAITERSWTLRNWYRHLHWRNMLVTVFVPLLGFLLWLIVDIRPTLQTASFAFLHYVLTMLSVNILYHRYWCHRSFQIESPHFVKLLVLIASGAGITSARNWCSAHRAHHRHSDITDRDPHNVRRGFFFSHIGWIVLTFNPQVVEAIHAERLDKFTNDEAVQWQARNYLSLFVSSGLILPCLFCGWLYDDYLGGLLYAGFLKVFLVQQSVFLTNSLGHLIGSRPYNSSISARNNLVVNLLTLGEGNQNFHQEFPNDCRNGSDWLSWDPTRWCLSLLQSLGIISHLRISSQSIIDKSRVQEQQRQLDNIRSSLYWGIPISRLPVYTPQQFRKLVSDSPGRFYVVVDGIIHDVTPFAKDHPGGIELMYAANGRDATTAFNGAVYQHSNAARNLLGTLRIGVLSGSEDIYWKQERIENKDVPLDSDLSGHAIVRSGSQATASNNIIGGVADAA